jgi:hypothetical protein
MSGPDQHRTEPAPADRSTEAAQTADAAALRDAHQIAARVAADEAAADEERTRLLAEPLPSLAAGDATPSLAHGEVLHAIRRSALIEREPAPFPVGGTLYLTSARLLFHGATGLTAIPLPLITDIAVALERLLLIGLADGSDLAIEVDQPRLLRVQLAAARAAARAPRE